MRKNVLRKLNFLVYIGMVLLATVLQSTIFKYFPLNYFQPDFVLILTVYLGFKRESIEGSTLVIIAALIMEAHSGSGKSFLLAIYVYCFVITKVLSKIIVVPNRITVVMITVALTLFSKIMNLFLLGLVGRAGNALGSTLLHMLPTLITQASASFLLLEVFAITDLKTFKDVHAEDEYDLNKEF